jgi:uncharacterized protein
MVRAPSVGVHDAVASAHPEGRRAATALRPGSPGRDTAQGEIDVLPMFGFDPTFILLIPAMIFAFWAQWKVKSTYQRYSRVRAMNGLTGAAMAARIMSSNGIVPVLTEASGGRAAEVGGRARAGVERVRIEAIGGVLSDHYDPQQQVVRLSEDNYAGDSIASIAVAAHEVGHVLQHAQGYAPLTLRTGIAPVANFGSMLAMPLFFIGWFFGAGHLTWLMDLGILFFAGAVVFHLVTLPVEFDASRRALAQLTSSGSISPDEVAGARKVLDAAALTYVAAAAMSALQLLRLVLLRNRRD